MLIEESKNSYYEELQNSSEKWHTGENNELPFVKYMLVILLKAYEECDNRFNLIGKEKLASPERVFSVIQKSLEPLSKKRYYDYLSGYIAKDNRASFKRTAGQ